MPNDTSTELATLSEHAATLAAEWDVVDLRGPLEEVETQADVIGRAWSGSNLGYQATVYYSGFVEPPPGAHFSSEWGFIGMFQGTSGDWVEMNRDDVRRTILERSGTPSIGDLEARGESARDRFRGLKERALSIVAAYSNGHEDEYLKRLEVRLDGIEAPTRNQILRSQMRANSTVTRDNRAAEGGWQSAPHQEVSADVLAIRAPFVAARSLAEVSDLIAEHMNRSAPGPPLLPVAQMGTTVFIGHGNSLQWRVLKDFLHDRLGLDWTEFNREPVAGITNIARLEEMLDSAAVAFLVLTAEDQQSSGEMVARQNVVHEAGLFQGRLGFNRAIVMLEDGCEEFSNINGLGQTRFASGRIESCFEEVRRVLEREGLILREDASPA